MYSSGDGGATWALMVPTAPLPVWRDQDTRLQLRPDKDHHGQLVRTMLVPSFCCMFRDKFLRL